MPAMKKGGEDAAALATLVRKCGKAVQSIQEASRAANVHEGAAKSLAKLTKRLLPLLEDIEEGVGTVASMAITRGLNSLTDVACALDRVHAVLDSCGVIGPVEAILNQDALVAEFLNSSSDLHSSLSSIQLAELKVDSDQAEGLQLTLQQLSRFTIDQGGDSAHAFISKARALSEGVRMAGKVVVGLSELPMLEEWLATCKVAQVAADAEFLQAKLAQAKQARNHVDACMFQLLLDLELPLLPSAAKGGSKGLGSMGSQRVLVPSGGSRPAQAEAQEEGEEGEEVDPVPIVQKLLNTVMQAGLPLEQRTQALQPLVAAAGLAPAVPNSPLHHGAVLFALSDPGCALKLVALLNERSTEPIIKGWLLALLLSLVHPATGLNPETLKVLLSMELVPALCRLISCSVADNNQKLQALHLLRTIIRDESTHAAIVGAQAINTIVQQISCVVVSKGHVHQGSGTPTKGSQQPQPQQSDEDSDVGGISLEQQRAELAILMIMDLAQGPYKGEILRSGGVLALVHRILDAGGHERVRAAACDSLAALGDDGLIAVQAAQYDVLVGLADMAHSSSTLLRKCSIHAAAVLLTPSPARSAATEEAALAGARAQVLHKPAQGKSARITRRPEDPPSPMRAPAPPTARSGAAPGPAAGGRSLSTSASAKPGATGAQGQQGQQQQGAPLSAEELQLEMGRALSPASTAALMSLLQLDDPELRALVLAFLPLSATDPACRAAIISHAGGLAVLLREAGARHPAAISTLRRVASDLKLKAKCAAAITEALVAAGGSTKQAANLATTMACVGALPPGPGSDKDRAALGAARDFAGKVVEAGGVPPLAALLRCPDVAAKKAAVLALRLLALYGDDKARATVEECDTLLHLVDVVKLDEKEWLVDPAPTSQFGKDVAPEPSVCQAACDALAGLATSEAVRHVVLSALAPLMNNEAIMTRACTAILAVAGNLPAAYTLLVRNGVLAQLVAILRGAPDNLLTQPARLFAAIVSLSAEGATLATHPSPSLDAAKKAGKGAGPPTEAGACSLLPLVMGRATDGVARAAAAAATGHLIKKDAKARDELIQVEGVVALVRVVQETAPSDPFFADACAALAAVACLIESSRVEVARSVRAMLLRPLGESAAAGARVCKALSHSPQGRALLFGEDLIDALIRTLRIDSPDAQCSAADALTHAASSGPIASAAQQPDRKGGAAGADAGKARPSPTQSPRLIIINKGAVVPLIEMLKSSSARVVFEAAFALEGLASISEGAAAVKRADGAAALMEVVKRGKRGEVSERTQAAAYAAYVKVL